MVQLIQPTKVEFNEDSPSYFEAVVSSPTLYFSDQVLINLLDLCELDIFAGLRLTDPVLFEFRTYLIKWDVANAYHWIQKHVPTLSNKLTQEAIWKAIFRAVQQNADLTTFPRELLADTRCFPVSMTSMNEYIRKVAESISTKTGKWMVATIYADHLAQLPILGQIVDWRTKYFGKIRGWNVPEVDTDVTDIESNTRHIVATSERLNVLAGARLHTYSLSKTEGVTKEQIAEQLANIPALPFVDGGLNDDVISQAQSNSLVVKGRLIPLEELSKIIPIDSNVNYLSTAQQITEILTDPESSNPILMDFLACIRGEKPFSIFERLMPPDFSQIDFQGIRKSLLGIPVLVEIMIEAATQEMEQGRHIWLIQCDDTFLALIKQLFGEESMYQIASINQLKNDRDRIVPDKCNTIVFDIRKALAWAQVNNPDIANRVLERLTQLDHCFHREA